MKTKVTFRCCVCVVFRICLCLFALSAVFTGAAGVSAQENPETPQRLLIKGNMAYSRENYDQAATYYEQILSQGKTNAAVYYNLANAYFKTEEIGAAVLNYQRALFLDPRDTDIRANYRYALSRAAVERKTAPIFFQRWAQGYFEFFSLPELAWCPLIVLALLAVVQTAGLFFYWPRSWRMTVNWVLAVFLFWNLGGLIYRWHDIRSRAVLLADAPARFEPRDDATVHFQVEEGETVYFLDREGAWAKVRRPDKVKGWVPLESVEKLLPDD
ncbi:MAG: tetratricopeptide repeat protein [Candidatus Omnitrophota bacterium]